MNGKPAVGICHGPRCGDYGGRALAAELKDQGVAVEVLDCQSLCPHSPVVRLNDRVIHRATSGQIAGHIKNSH